MADLDSQGPRPLAGLIERLRIASLLTGTRRAGRPIAPSGLGDVVISGPVTNDSRLVVAGGVFVAVTGARTDGHDHAPEAIARGAAALVVERPIPDLAVAQVVVSAARPALAHAAAWWYGDPSRALTVIGITGTDGKTTTSYLAMAALEAAGRSPGLIGTIATRIGDDLVDHVEHATTPEAPVVQATLRAMVEAGNDVAIIETTSHALALDRVAAIDYDVAILTNITHEHLELHGTFEAYRAAKTRLFAGLRGDGTTAIVNRDDPSAPHVIAAALAAGATVTTYGTDPAADVRATSISDRSDGLVASVATPDGEVDLRLALIGRFNILNAMAVIALGRALGLDGERVLAGMAGLDRVPGRMERLVAGQPFEVIVDFAHSPASLQAVLDLLAPGAAARGGGVIAVFGSAGERDTAKRAVMGRIAGDRARLVVLTDEDPRREDRLAILEQIAAGAQAAGRERDHDLLLIPDRTAAIAAAFEAARPGDVVLLAGKGHERSIAMGDREQPWDERAVALAALADLGYRRPAD